MNNTKKITKEEKEAFDELNEFWLKKGIAESRAQLDGLVRSYSQAVGSCIQHEEEYPEFYDGILFLNQLIYEFDCITQELKTTN